MRIVDKCMDVWVKFRKRSVGTDCREPYLAQYRLPRIVPGGEKRWT